jgi:hypothetical protein
MAKKTEKSPAKKAGVGVCCGKRLDVVQGRAECE